MTFDVKSTQDAYEVANPVFYKSTDEVDSVKRVDISHDHWNEGSGESMRHDDSKS